MVLKSGKLDEAVFLKNDALTDSPASGPDEDDETDELFEEAVSSSRSKSMLRGELDLNELASEENTLLAAEVEELDENDPPLDVLSNCGICGATWPASLAKLPSFDCKY